MNHWTRRYLSRAVGTPSLSMFGLLALSLLLAPAAAIAEVPSSSSGVLAFPDPVTETHIEAEYDPETFRVKAKMRLVWRNTSSVPVEDLQFHHYLNAFANNRSSFMEGTGGGQLRGDRFDGDRWGWLDVSSIQLVGLTGGGGDAEGEGGDGGSDLGSANLDVADRELDRDYGEGEGVELKGVEEFLAPDDGNEEDRTVARYVLPRAVPPGGSVELEIEYDAQLPTIFARTGADEEYVLGAQWFPKIAVFEDAGMRGRGEAGWNCHQFHPNSEFYADFGNYDVTLTLPERYQGKIGATGVLASEEVVDGKVSARFVQEAVHDFAWTADPSFVVMTDRFEPERDVPPELRTRIAGYLGVAESELALPPVDITLFVQKPHVSQADRYFRSAKEAIAGYGLRLGPYPWSTLTMVDPPHTGRGSGGMEYPTFITLGTDALLEMPVFDNIILPEIVTIHEFGHQYFQGMIASNEFEESWIDEGINSYYETEVVGDHYGKEMNVLGFRWKRLDSERTSVLGEGPYRDPIATPAWKFYSGGSYGSNSYPRPAVTLHHLKRLLGDEVFHKAMRHFFEKHRFTHPSTYDFEVAIEESTGQDLGWYFEQALHSTRGLDYSVREFRTRKLRDEKGIFWRDGERSELGKKDDGEGEEEGDEEGAADEDGDADEETLYASRVTVQRDGEFVHPVTVEFTFDDGEILRETWDGVDRWKRWTFEKPERLESVVVDPDGLLLLENNRLDNGRTRKDDSRPAAKISSQILFWVQSLLQLTTLLG